MANNNVVLQWNCRGLSANITELDKLIAEYKYPAVICLQETLLEKDQRD